MCVTKQEHAANIRAGAVLFYDTPCHFEYWVCMYVHACMQRFIVRPVVRADLSFRMVVVALGCKGAVI